MTEIVAVIPARGGSKGVPRKNLRRGDTISRYSAMQYVVLLPAVTYETGKMVMERIKSTFYASQVKSSVSLTYKIRSLSVNKYELARLNKYQAREAEKGSHAEA